jgi:perosamine synthetase
MSLKSEQVEDAVRYPVAHPDISQLEIDAAAETVRSTWISSIGPRLEEFEATFAEACGVEHAIAVANGTVALHVALEALGIGPGDEVIVPSLTYIATANTVRYTGASPVFADVSRDTWCLDPDHVASLVSPRTAAIVAVHLYGHPADMDALGEIARAHGLALLEDAAEAPFATYRGRPTGGLGTVAGFSFFGNKIITSGEGGAVTTNDSGLAARLRLLRGQGMDPDRRYFFPVVGYNYRLTNLAASILCAQMARKGELLLKRDQLFAAYDSAFAEMEAIEPQPIAPWATRAPWLYTVLIRDGGMDRDVVMSRLGVDGVDSRPMFIPLHTLPPYLNSAQAPLPVTEDLASRGLSLPTSSVWGADDAREIARRLERIVGRS